MNQWVGLAVFGWLLCPGAVTAEETEPVDPQAHVIEELVHQLDATTYEQRKTATDQLVQVGAAVVDRVRMAVVDSATNQEVQMRALEVLQRLALDGSDEAKLTARAALNEIATTAQANRLRRATQRVLADVAKMEAEVAMNELLELGMTLGPARDNVFPVVQLESQQLFNIGTDWAGTAADLEKLRHLPQMRVLKLSGQLITDEYLARVAQLEMLQFLHLNHAKITPQGLAHLAKAPGLRRLRVLNTTLEQTAIDALCQLKVGQLQLVGTRLKPNDGELLAQRMPFCEVEVRNGAFLGVGGTQGWQGLPGCELNTISPESAASRAGLRIGDRIVKYEDKPIADFDELREQIGQNFPGDKVTVEVVRDGRKLNLEVTMGEMTD